MVQDVCSFDKMKLSEEIGIPVEEIEEFCMRIQPTVSLTTEEGVSDLPDLSPSPEDEAADNELPELLETLIEKADLDESELFVIRNRFKDAPLSLADCAKSLGVSPKAVKGIETRALGYLRETAEAMGIDSFFE
jgi:DNA-directed RNA polymerase sigma subunit (sigma70/sigma32)